MRVLCARILGTAAVGAAALGCGASPGEAIDEQREALGATYYVAITGNDASSGTAAAPWRTLQKAVDSIAPGDTVVVAAGTYAGARVTRSGEAGAPKTIRAAAGARPILASLSPRAAHSAIFEVESFDGRIGHWVIDGFEITGSPGAGVDLRDTTHVTVRNCFVHHNGKAKRATGIFMAFSDHPIIVDNESSYNSEHGIYQSNSGDYPVLERNRLHHNTVCGVHVNGDASFGGDGQVSYGSIQGNVIYENGASGGSAINLDGMSDSVIANNLLYENRAGGIALFGEDGAEPSSRNKVYGNTVVMAAGSRWAVNVPTPGAVGNRIVDNILLHPDAGRGAISVHSPAAIYSDYNVVVGRFSPDTSRVVALEQWRAYGRDVHSRVATAAELFVNPAARDYHLKAGSPAIDAGTTLAELPRDGDGELRPQGSAVDVGWDERAAATPTPTPTPTPVPPPSPACAVASAGFANSPIAAQTGRFTLEWLVTPSAASVDAAVGVSAGAATRWTSLAAIVRFNPSGAIDARNGATYAALRSVRYTAGAQYRVRLVVDVPARRYDVFVQPPGATDVQIASRYAFRTEQAGATRLDSAVVASDSARLTACGLKVQ